jgi:hypothetical protein
MDNEATFSLSVNSNIIGKPGKSERIDFARGFQPIEATSKQIMDLIQCGYAIAPQYSGGHRKASNFIQTSVLGADIDGDMTLGEARQNLFVLRNASFIHTTASHTEQHHRFRIILLLEKPIESAPDYAAALLGVAAFLGSDRSIADGGRMFFGNKDAIFVQISRTLSTGAVANLIARGKDVLAQRASPTTRPWAVDSTQKLGSGDLVKLANGESCRVDELRSGVSVHCPYHDDDNPSAFIVQSFRGGGLGIHCCACKVTFWRDDERDSYDFGAFARLFHQSRMMELPPQEQELEGFDRFFPPQPRFERLNRKFLPPIKYRAGLTFVRSPKGSGKTEALVSLLESLRLDSSKDRVKSALLIGHRRTLLREAAAKLDMRCYLDAEIPPDKLHTLAVSLDSLHKYAESFAGSGGKPGWKRPKGGFDLVIIDEVEQVLKHLMSETIEKRAGLERCFDALHQEIANAKAVIALDADLGLLSTHAMRVMRRRDWEGGNCSIVYNEQVISSHKRKMRLFADRKRLEREVIEAIKRGEKCFITSNSKECVLDLERMIRNECGDGIVMRVVTGKNSHQSAVVDFVKNIKTEFIVVQVVLTSPSMGTGIDITFPGGACVVQRVFGFFYSMINAHTDIDQQLCRVRNPGQVDVWVSAITYDFTCNVEVIKDDLARAYTVRRAVKGRRSDGMVEYDRDDPLLTICAHVTALERASKNRLVDLFCKLREDSGWVIERVDEKERASPYKEAKKQRKQERAQLLLEAPSLTDADFIDLDARVEAGDVLSPEEEAAREKHVFRTTVGVELDAELVQMNLDGRLIDRVQTLAPIVAIWGKPHLDDPFAMMAEPTRLPNGRLQNMALDRTIGVLLRVAGLTDRAGIKPGHVATAAGLADFARVCRENRTVVEEVFGEAVRDDLEKNPVRQLNAFLKRIGLKLKREKTAKTAGGGKLRFYSLDHASLSRMISLAHSYLEAETRREKAEQDRRPSRDRSPQQGTQERPSYIDSNIDLLSLIDPV